LDRVAIFGLYLTEQNRTIDIKCSDKTDAA
jgi:hypothetical protein